MRGYPSLISVASSSVRIGVAVCLLSLIVESAVMAQPAPAASAPESAQSLPKVIPPTKVVAPAPIATEWNELTPRQQQALRPLATSWSTVDEPQKRKWLALSRNFSTLPLAEQIKLHSRMAEWATLSPKERIQARLNFAATKKVPVDEKLAKWQAYQALSPEEKRKLAASAVPRPPGAAPAVKPVALQKLATLPDAKPPRSAASSLAAPSDLIDPKTLLPRRPHHVP